ncbi:MAG: hypothetical protein ABIT08_12795 [Bacteroidia bacterium]
MDTNIGYLQTPLTWEFKKKKAFLKSDNKTILELRTGKKRSSFELDKKTYDIRNKGFWNPSTAIVKDKKTVVMLKRFFRSHAAWIDFLHGSKYLIRCKNEVFIKLSIYSADHIEIVRYKLISKYKASMNLYVNSANIPEMDKVFLMILGCFIFRGIIKENKLTDLESIVFANAVPVKELLVTEPV